MLNLEQRILLFLILKCSPAELAALREQRTRQRDGLDDDERAAIDELTRRFFAGEPCSTSTLAAALGWERAKVVDVMHRLHAAGLIDRTPSASPSS